MFIDRLLEGWHDVVCVWEGLDKENLKDCLTQTVVFNISNVFEYFKRMGGVDLKKDLPNVYPVYDAAWFEFDANVKYDNDISVRKIGIGAFIQNKSQGKYDNTIHVCSPVFMELASKMCLVGQVCWEVDINGLTEAWVYEARGNKVSPQEALKTLEVFFFPVMWLSLAFLHCKNVTILSDQIPDKLQSARKKRGKRPLVTYHTLEIKPMVKILRNEGHSETEGLQRALHICRGHFKDFTDKGLFGKYHGLYWWNSQVRGNATEGIALKDYKVSPGGSPTPPPSSEAVKP